jgi:5-formyltetrahydrofolate cyclo-ligase
MKKSELRQIYLDKRRALSPRELADQSRKIADIFFASFDLSAVKFLHAFLSIDKFHEIDTSPIFERTWSEHSEMVLVAPLVEHQNGRMDQVIFHSETSLVQNKWGIPEPVGGISVSAEVLDMVLVPLLCFDRKGHRVGYGKGLYDTLLNLVRKDCITVGLSVFTPVARIDDISAHDVKLQYCVTPNELFVFS